MAIPTKAENPNGLHQKYYISKIVDGIYTEPVKEEYFVLKLTGDSEHVKACKTAVLAYAEAIKHINPTLANDIIERYGIK